MFIETILAYIILILPSAITILGGIATCAVAINKMRKSSAETDIIVAQAKETMNKVRDTNDIKELRALVKETLAEKKELQKALTLAAEEIRRIHQLHPEWLEGKEGNE